jgi:signal transduction histidine kinase/PAS domain-containing protein
LRPDSTDQPHSVPGSTASRAAPGGAAPDLAEIIERITDAFFAVDGEWRFTYVNRRAEPLLRRAPADLLGRVLWEEFPDAVGTQFWHEYHRAMREGTPVTFVEHYPPLGRWFEVNAYPGADGLSVYFRDVTDRVHYQLVRERQNDMLNAVEVGAWYCDLPFDVLEWDRKVKEHFWLPSDARVTIETFYDRIHADDRARTREAIDRSIATQSPYDIEYRTVAPPESPRAGAVRWVRAIGYTAYDPQGRPVRFDGLTVDVTAQKSAVEALAEAERAIREEARLVETLQRIGSTLAAELDLTTVVQTVTDEATRLTGAQFGAFFYNVLNDRGESYMLYTISGVPREHFSKFPMPRNTRVFAPTFHGEGIMRSADITKDPRYGHNAPHHGMPKGHLPVVSYLAVPVKSHSGEVIGGLFFGSDQAGVFTERHERLVEGIAGWAALAMDNARLFEAQRSAAAEAAQANHAKSEFLARMSHDLRTPLNAIGGYAQLLDMGVHGPVNDTQRDALGRVRRAQEHLLTIINDILSFAKLEAGQVHVQPEPVAMAPLLVELAAMVEPEAAARGLALRVEHAPADLVARADRERLMQVLLNLTSNALKFTPHGGLTLTAAATPEWVHVAVRDSGIGVPADKLEAIFDPFMQGRGSPAERRDGVGLGLAISRELTRMMGGDVTVTSVEGEGSTFTVQVPRVIEPTV